MQDNQHIEFKSSFNDSVIETITAFANAKELLGNNIIIRDYKKN